MPRSHTPKGRLARGRILRVAEKLLVARGFHGTSVRDVADAAGQPLATVVYHFPKKEQLYAAVLADIAAEVERALGEALAASEGPFTDRLARLATALVRWADASPGRVRLLLRELLDNPARVSRAERLPLAPVLTGIASFVEAGARAGELRAVVPELAVLHVVGAVTYVVAAKPTVRRIVGPTRERRLTRAREREAVAFVVAALTGSPPSRPRRAAPKR